jgi:hypothetical protein
MTTRRESHRRLCAAIMFLSLGCCAMSVLAQTAAGGLRWAAPAGWKIGGAQPMRAATYGVAAAAGDAAGGECVLYFFGAGQGGSVDANIERWKSQFSAPGGKPVVPKVAKRTVHGLPVTTIDVSGEYSGMGGPMAAASRAASGYRLLGAIVEGPGGNVFVKFTGPAKTIDANQPKFESLLASFQQDK